MLGGVWEMKGCEDGVCGVWGVTMRECVWWGVGDEGCVRMVE